MFTINCECCSYLHWVVQPVCKIQGLVLNTLHCRRKTIRRGYNTDISSWPHWFLKESKYSIDKSCRKWIEVHGITPTDDIRDKIWVQVKPSLFAVWGPTEQNGPNWSLCQPESPDGAIWSVRDPGNIIDHIWSMMSLGINWTKNTPHSR